MDATNQNLVGRYRKWQERLKELISYWFPDTRLTHIIGYRVRYPSFNAGKEPDLQRQYIAYLRKHVKHLSMCSKYRQAYYKNQCSSNQAEDKGHKFARETFTWMYETGIQVLTKYEPEWKDTDSLVTLPTIMPSIEEEYDKSEVSDEKHLIKISLKKEPKQRKKMAREKREAEEVLIKKTIAKSREENKKGYRCIIGRIMGMLHRDATMGCLIEIFCIMQDKMDPEFWKVTGLIHPMYLFIMSRLCLSCATGGNNSPNNIYNLAWLHKCDKFLVDLYNHILFSLGNIQKEYETINDEKSCSCFVCALDAIHSERMGQPLYTCQEVRDRMDNDLTMRRFKIYKELIFDIEGKRESHIVINFGASFSSSRKLVIWCNANLNEKLAKKIFCSLSCREDLFGYTKAKICVTKLCEHCKGCKNYIHLYMVNLITSHTKPAVPHIIIPGRNVEKRWTLIGITPLKAYVEELWFELPEDYASILLK